MVLNIYYCFIYGYTWLSRYYGLLQYGANWRGRRQSVVTISKFYFRVERALLWSPCTWHCQPWQWQWTQLRCAASGFKLFSSATLARSSTRPPSLLFLFLLRPICSSLVTMYSELHGHRVKRRSKIPSLLHMADFFFFTKTIQKFTGSLDSRVFCTSLATYLWCVCSWASYEMWAHAEMLQPVA